LCLFRDPGQCTLQVCSNTVQQVDKFKYLGVVFTSDKMRREIDTPVVKANAVLRERYCSVVTKREFSTTAQ